MIDGVGDKTLREIEMKLAEVGLKLRVDLQLRVE